jgi:hypothetical protein
MKSPKAKKEQPQLPALPERIRPELNIEKWSIWQPANSRTPLRAKFFEREIEIADGRRVIAKLKIGFTDEGTLTTDEQRVYYALVKLWEEHGRNEGFTPVSLYRLVKILGKPWGGKDRKRLRRALMRLRVTPLVWEKSYIDAVKDTRLDLLHPFTIIDDLKIARRKEKGEEVSEVGYFRFHEAILKNLLADYTKPVLIDVVLSFKSEIAQILYTHLDLILSDKASYERRTKELFEDLGLEGETYRYASKRKEKLEPALKELQGKSLTTGAIATAKLEPTKDGADLKLVVRKGKAKAELTLPVSNVIPLPLPALEPPNEGQELVRHFHKVFHGTDKCYPTGKAIDQAETLIARHGIHKARHIIEFAKREAQKTAHKIATFGGIMQYEVPALADFEQKRQDRERQRTAERAAETKQQAEAEHLAIERAEEAEFDEQWSRWSESEREAFQAEAMNQAEQYGLKFAANRYREQPDKTSEYARVYLLKILRAHYRQIRQERSRAANSD